MSQDKNAGDHKAGELQGRYQAQHLTEFYSIVNDNEGVINAADGDDAKHKVENGRDNDSRANLEFARRMSDRPGSIRSSVSTIGDLRTLVTHRDMKETADAMQHLVNDSRAYSSSLKYSSSRSSMLAASLEKLAKLKGCNDSTADKLLNASGLFYLLANHERIMSQIVCTVMSDSVEQDLENFRLDRSSLETDFKVRCKEQSSNLKTQEKLNNKLSKSKTRNFVSYRESLFNLQAQLDQLETLRHDYYQDSYSLVESSCESILQSVASVSKAQVEVSENIARKGWSGGGLDELLTCANDPFIDDSGTPEESGHNESLNNDGTTRKHTKQGSATSHASIKSVQNNLSSTVKQPLLEPSTTPLKMKANSPLKRDQSYSPLKVSSRSIEIAVASKDDDEHESDIDSDLDNSFSLPLTVNSKKPNNLPEFNSEDINTIKETQLASEIQSVTTTPVLEQPILDSSSDI